MSIRSIRSVFCSLGPCARRLALLSLILACSPNVNEEAPPTEMETETETETPIIGGVFAGSRQLDAVGLIVRALNPSEGIVAPWCTGTLIGPHTVLTAAHCVLPVGAELYFYVGFDARAPKEMVRVVSGQTGPLVVGGFAGVGSDVGIMQLANDVTSAKPIAISTNGLSDEDVGDAFLQVGYGAQTNPESNSGDILVRRRRALTNVSLIATEGHALQSLWRTPDALLAYIQARLPEVTLEIATAVWTSGEYMLLSGQQAFLSGLPINGGQACHGDSGGPVLRREEGQWAVVGVHSAVVANLGEASCWAGAMIGRLDPEANMAFLEAALSDECRGVPVSGVCNLDSAIRCTSDFQLNLITITECGHFGLACGVETMGEAACVDRRGGGPASTCSVVGTFDRARGNITFDETGAYSATGSRFLNSGRFVLDAGILSLAEEGPAQRLCGTGEGKYALTFSEDCATFSLALIEDPCHTRAPVLDSTTNTRR